MSTEHHGNLLNEVNFEEHEGTVNGKKVYFAPLSVYQQQSLVSGYAFYGLAIPGSNPTQARFKLQRETLSSGDLLHGDGVSEFKHIWSSASLASIPWS